MSLLYSHKDIGFETSSKDCKRLRIWMSYDVKRNFGYLFTVNWALFNRLMINCVKSFLSSVNIKDVHEGGNINRLIDDYKLDKLNEDLYEYFKDEYGLKGIKVKNFKITHIIH